MRGAWDSGSLPLGHLFADPILMISGSKGSRDSPSPAPANPILGVVIRKTKACWLHDEWENGLLLVKSQVFTCLRIFSKASPSPTPDYVLFTGRDSDPTHSPPLRVTPKPLYLAWWSWGLKINNHCPFNGFLDGSVIKKPPAMQEPQETRVQFLGGEDPLEEGMAAHSSILAQRIPWTEEPGGLQSMGSQSQTRMND